jgi:hypothetical protein
MDMTPQQMIDHGNKIADGRRGPVYLYVDKYAHTVEYFTPKRVLEVIKVSEQEALDYIHWTNEELKKQEENF